MCALIVVMKNTKTYLVFMVKETRMWNPKSKQDAVEKKETTDNNCVILTGQNNCQIKKIVGSTKCS